MRQAPPIIRLNDEEVKTLAEWSRRGKQENRLVERARIILLAHQGKTNQQIARPARLGCRNGDSASGESGWLV